MLSFNHLLASILLLCEPIVSNSGLYHEGLLSLFFSSEKYLSSWWYTPSFLQLLRFRLSPQLLFPLSLGWLLRGLLSSSVFVIIAMNLFCCANIVFCWSYRYCRSVSCVIFINTACSLALSSSDLRLLVYSIMVYWLVGDIWSVVMLVGGLDNVLLLTVASVLHVREVRLLVLSYPPVWVARSSLNFSLLLYSFTKYDFAPPPLFGWWGVCFPILSSLDCQTFHWHTCFRHRFSPCPCRWRRH